MKTPKQTHCAKTPLTWHQDVSGDSTSIRPPLFQLRGCINPPCVGDNLPLSWFWFPIESSTNITSKDRSWLVQLKEFMSSLPFYLLQMFSYSVSSRRWSVWMFFHHAMANWNIHPFSPFRLIVTRLKPQPLGCNKNFKPWCGRPLPWILWLLLTWTSHCQKLLAAWSQPVQPYWSIRLRKLSGWTILWNLWNSGSWDIGLTFDILLLVASLSRWRSLSTINV